MKNNNNILSGGALLLGGLITGYVASLFVSPSERAKHKKKALQLKSGIENQDLEQLSQTIFGISSKDLETKLQQVFSSLNNKAQNFLASTEAIDEKKYRRAIDALVDSLQKDKVFTKVELQKLKQYLQSDYKFVTNNT